MQDFYNPEKTRAIHPDSYGALTEIGFFAVRNTGVDREVIREAYAQAETFFKKDAEFKVQSFCSRISRSKRIGPRRNTAKG
jgi:isopenicillin N synthase-like dioxygenase